MNENEKVGYVAEVIGDENFQRLSLGKTIYGSLGEFIGIAAIGEDMVTVFKKSDGYYFRDSIIDPIVEPTQYGIRVSGLLFVDEEEYVLNSEFSEKLSSSNNLQSISEIVFDYSNILGLTDTIYVASKNDFVGLKNLKKIHSVLPLSESIEKYPIQQSKSLGE